MSKKLHFGEEPKSAYLGDGRTVVYYDIEETTEPVEIRDAEGEPTGETETRPLWLCSRLIIENPKDENGVFVKITKRELVPALIRTKYLPADETAIIRQQESKPEEYEEWNAFAEECKAKADAILADLELQ